jgi:hypothetical protein
MQKDTLPGQARSGDFIYTQLFAFCRGLFAIGEYNIIISKQILLVKKLNYQFGLHLGQNLHYFLRTLLL